MLAVAAVGAAVAYQTTARERDYRLLLARGDAALRADQTFGAIEAYSGAIALRPDSMLAHLRRGETYRRRNDLDDAARDFRMAATLDPSAMRALEEWGDVLYQQQRWGRAAELYEQRLKLDERAPAITYKLALARYRDHKLAAAVAALAQTLRLDDRIADAYYLRGLCLRDQNELTGAIAAFEKAVERAPGLISAREELAEVYASLGRRNEELQQLQVIAGLDREHVERQVVVGVAYARAARDAHDAGSQERHANLAILTLGNALDRAPDQPLIYGALGQVWLDIAIARNDGVALRKALQALERAAASSTATSEVLTFYGRALVRDNRIDAAEQVLKQATERFPVEPAAFLDYAAIAERINHLDAARTALNNYSALVTNDLDAAAHAAKVAELSARIERATAAAAGRADRADRRRQN